MQKTNQIKRPFGPWHVFRYSITNGDKVCYRIRRSGLEKYRQFEDMDQNILYFMGMNTLQSNDHQIMAEIDKDGKNIKTVLGHFIRTDMDLSRRKFTLKCYDQTVAQVRKIRHLTHEEMRIELMNIHEQNLVFIFALLILIDSFDQTLQNPLFYYPIPHRPW